MNILNILMEIPKIKRKEDALSKEAKNVDVIAVSKQVHEAADNLSNITNDIINKINNIPKKNKKNVKR